MITLACIVAVETAALVILIRAHIRACEELEEIKYRYNVDYDECD